MILGGAPPQEWDFKLQYGWLQFIIPGSQLITLSAWVQKATSGLTFTMLFVCPCELYDFTRPCQFSSVQSLSRGRFFATPWLAACQASLSITNSWSLLKLMSIEPLMPSNHLILCCPLLLLPSISPSIRVFSNESILHNRRPEYWSISFNIGPSNEYSGLISFRIDWFDFLAVQGTLKSLLHHYSSKVSILRR